ncbi:MAG: dephospho-CoA kinase [Thermoflexales bacterium]|nr:dephospho-CoA kinase [Thermoflexales bacterium]
MYIIGLTGNIATGKSTVSAMLAELGAHVIDADALVHTLQQRGQPVYTAIVAEFGPGILRPGGEIERGRLGARVFADPAELARLEAIVHPAVNQEIEYQIANIKSQIATAPAEGEGQKHARATGRSEPETLNLKPETGIVVIEAIKLIETGRHASCQALWVVTAPYQVQLDRLMRRRGLGEAEARLRIEAQPPQADKIALADVVIDNGGDMAYTRRQVIENWEEIRKRL